MSFRTLESLLEFYFDVSNGNISSLDMAKFTDGCQIAKRTGEPNWLGLFSTIGYYFRELKDDTQTIIGLSFYNKMSDQDISVVLNGEIKRRIWNVYKVRDDREDATQQLDRMFRKVNLIEKRYEYG